MEHAHEDWLIPDVILASLCHDAIGADECGSRDLPDQATLCRLVSELALAVPRPARDTPSASDHRVRTLIRSITALANRDPAGWPCVVSVAAPDGATGPAHKGSRRSPRGGQQIHRQVARQLFRLLLSVIGKDERQRIAASAQLAAALQTSKGGRALFAEWLKAWKATGADRIRVELVCLAQGAAETSQWVADAKIATPKLEVHRLVLDHLAADMGLRSRPAAGKRSEAPANALRQMAESRASSLAAALADLCDAHQHESDARAERVRDELTRAASADVSALVKRVADAEAVASAARSDADVLRAKLRSHADSAERGSKQTAPATTVALRDALIRLVDTTDGGLTRHGDREAEAGALRTVRDTALGALREASVYSGRAIRQEPEPELVEQGCYELLGSATASQRLRIRRRAFFALASDARVSAVIRPGWAESASGEPTGDMGV